MFPIKSLSVCLPRDANAGSMFIANAHYEKPPLFICGAPESEKKFAFEFAEGGFKLFPAETVNKPHLQIVNFQLRVDVKQLTSPNRDHITPGTLRLIGSELSFVVEQKFDDFYVNSDGIITNDYQHDKAAYFKCWELVFQDGHDDHVIYRREPSEEHS